MPQCQQAQAQIDEIRRQIVVTEDVETLQEVGVYDYRHPLSDAAAYQVEADNLVRGSIRRKEFLGSGATT